MGAHSNAVPGGQHHLAVLIIITQRALDVHYRG